MRADMVVMVGNRPGKSVIQMAQTQNSPANEGTTRYWMCEKVVVLTLVVVEDRKSSPTQPGRGIRKIVDLYHDISDLLDKAKKHSSIVLNELKPAVTEEMDKIDFVGMSEDEIEEEQKEYARPHVNVGVTDMITAANGVIQR